jgi:CubicO group peptidase (beta-lactamase class C family)
MDARAATSLLERHASRQSVPGAVLGVLHHGQRTIACYGVADVASGRSVDRSTTFSLGSLTKSATATVIVGLVQDGRISPNDTVAARVPELSACPWAARATIAELMANRSRLPLRSATEFDMESRAEDTGPDALARLATHVAASLAHEEAGPDVWSYTNVGWCLLGRVVEAATGQTFEDAVRDRLAERCGWRVRFAGIDPTDDRARGYAAMPSGPEPVPPLAVRAYAPAGATAVATVDDLLDFAALHLDEASLEGMRQEHAAVRIDGWLDAWCLGWARFDGTGGTAWGWDSVVPGERAVLRLFPDRRTAVVLLTNSDRGRALYRSLFAELLPDLVGVGMPHASWSTAAAGVDLPSYAGVYAWPDSRVTVTVAGDHLIVEEDGRIENAVPLGGGTFLVDEDDPDTPTVTFGAYDDRGRPGVLYRMLWGLPRVAADRETR